MGPSQHIEQDYTESLQHCIELRAQCIPYMEVQSSVPSIQGRHWALRSMQCCKVS